MSQRVTAIAFGKRAAAVVFHVVCVSACSEPVFMGSEVLWLARHEGADMAEWEEGDRGGAMDGVAEVTGDLARTGGFALRLLNPADRLDAGPCVWRQFENLPRAYYSAWYMLPEAPITISGWTLLRFASLGTADDDDDGGGGQGGAAGAGTALGGAPGMGGASGGMGGAGAAAPSYSVIQLGMRSLPDGTLALYVFDHSRDYLRLPIALPTPVVPVGRWFHLEVFYQTADEPDGRFVVWLDGQPVYGIANRGLGNGSDVTFALCNAGEAEGDEPFELFVDDVVVSRVRATPHGKLER